MLRRRALRAWYKDKYSEVGFFSHVSFLSGSARCFALFIGADAEGGVSLHSCLRILFSFLFWSPSSDSQSGFDSPYEPGIKEIWCSRLFGPSDLPFSKFHLNTTADQMLAQGQEMFSWIPNAYITRCWEPKIMSMSSSMTRSRPTRRASSTRARAIPRHERSRYTKANRSTGVLC
jgi:hypothetical protein